MGFNWQRSCANNRFLWQRGPFPHDAFHIKICMATLLKKGVVGLDGRQKEGQKGKKRDDKPSRGGKHGRSSNVRD